MRTLRLSGGNDIRYLRKDHLGSVDTITDEFGAVVHPSETSPLEFNAGKLLNSP